MNTNTGTWNDQGTFVYNIDVTSTDFTIADLAEPAKSFYIFSNESGVVVADCMGGDTITINITAWVILPLQFTTIYSTGTTIPNLIAII